jgi:hypothetical protein
MVICRSSAPPLRCMFGSVASAATDHAIDRAE